MKILFGLFLIAHGLIHASYISPRPPQNGGPTWPFDLTKSWLLTPAGLNTDTIKTIGIILTLAVTAGFVLSGLGWLGLPFLKVIWVPITVVSSILSILLLVLYWHYWLILGPLIDLVILYLVYLKGWRPL